MVPYSINLYTGNTQCILSNLKLSKDEKFVLPQNYEDVKTLTIQSSTIPRLTEDLVGAFPNLACLTVYSNEIEEISEDAFVGCKNLTYISLINNRLKTLEKNTFNRNASLKYLSLSGNRLEFLPDEIFLNLENLETLDINRNKLTSLPEIIHLKSLSNMCVEGNQLMDLNAEEILKQCPNLRNFGINANDFNFDVLQKIQEALTDAHVCYKGFSDMVRFRPYDTRKMDDIEYIPDVEYERLLAKRQGKIEHRQISVQEHENLMEKKIDLMQQKIESTQNGLLEVIQKTREEHKKIVQERNDLLQQKMTLMTETMEKFVAFQKVQEEQGKLMQEKVDFMQEKMTLMMESIQNGLLEKFEALKNSI